MKIFKKINKYISENYPDWDVTIALRYLPIAKSIFEKFPHGSSIIDIGSGVSGIFVYTALMKNPERYRFVGTDIAHNTNIHGVKIVKASAEKLPFKNDQFDISVSVDMLEHIDPKSRQKAIDEMVRVSSSSMYLAFPSGKTSEFIDRVVSKYYRFTHKSASDFLNEHVQNGLPKAEEVLKSIKLSCNMYNKKCEVSEKGNTNIFVWISLLFLGFSQNRLLTNIYRKMLLLLPILRYLNFYPNYRVLYKIDFL